MDGSDFPPNNSIVLRAVSAELELMRDALMQLSLALSDYRLFIESNNLSETAIDVEIALTKIMAAVQCPK